MSRKITQKEFGNFLRSWRERAGLTQRFVSQHFTSPIRLTVHAWESGDRLPHTKTIEKLTDLYNAGDSLMIAWAHVV